MNKVWLSEYPQGVPHEIDPGAYGSLLDLVDESLLKWSPRVAYRFMGQDWRFREIDAQSRRFAAYLQGLGLARGDRVAVMLPNLPQYPIAVLGILRAGLVVVNVNPLYTARELHHQLADSGARAIVIVESFAHTLQACLATSAAVSRPALEQLRHIVLATIGDMLGWPKGLLLNHVVRQVRKLVPAYELPQAVPWKRALSASAGLSWQRPALEPDDMAVLQYTSGTTGVSKGAMLSHRNIIANLLQAEAWNLPIWSKLGGVQPVTICALPLHHIFGFTVCMMLGLKMGACNVLILNPRDLNALLKDLARQPFHSFPGANTLFHALVHHPDFISVDWSQMRVTAGGGMAVQQVTAKLWQARTGITICEGYGLSETAPCVTCNLPTSRQFTGSIGLPMPSTEVAIVDDAGRELPLGSSGEIAVRGPQVMLGYWQRPDETAQAFTVDGYFRTGDIGVMDQHGYVRLIDRKKDLILVSGFNVYPSEIEDVMTQMPGILEAGAVGIPDERAGEVVKLVLVRDPDHQPAVMPDDVQRYCEANLTGYKRPKRIEFRSELPKTPVGKILRRELRG